MEPSRDLVSEEESGWTTYIGSPIYNEISNDEEQRVDIEDYGKHYKNGHEHSDDDDKGDNIDDSNKDNDDEESDDSMVSDASSHPSHLQLVCINSEGSHGLDFAEHTENDHDKILSTKRATKQVKKKRYEGMVEKEEENSLLVADSAASHV